MQGARNLLGTRLSLAVLAIPLLGSCEHQGTAQRYPAAERDESPFVDCDTIGDACKAECNDSDCEEACAAGATACTTDCTDDECENACEAGGDACGFECGHSNCEDACDAALAECESQQ